MGTFELAREVVETVETWVAQGKTFTAWDVTSSLRRVNRQTNIEHDLVRASVHAAMEHLVSSGEYNRELKQYWGGNAFEYSPGTPSAIGIVTGRIHTIRDIPMIEVDSSFIEAVGYETATSILRVKLARGSIYDYKDVPATLYIEFLQSESKGKFYNKYIKPLSDDDS